MEIVQQNQFINQLSEQLKLDLPGVEAQNAMAHKVRQRKMTAPDNVRVACVLALLYPKNNEWHTVLMKRVSNSVSDKHKGQISFPGGKLEEFDASLEAAALREAHEEVNIRPDEVKVLGRLTELYIPVSNFIVHPFVGFSESEPDLKPDPSEVAEIISMPLAHFQDKSNIDWRDIRITPNITLREVPYYKLQREILWGATAMMMNEMLEVIKKL